MNEVTETLLILSGVANLVMIVWIFVYDNRIDDLERYISRLEIEKMGGIEIKDDYPKDYIK